MKKYLYIPLTILAIALLSGCEETEGTDPGSDAVPVVTIYQYAVSAPYNSDEDVRIRFAPNNQVVKYYYLAELLSEKEDFISQQGEEAYADRVASAGSQVSAEDENEAIITGMSGTYAITVAAEDSKGRLYMYETLFYGLSWTTITEGVYVFGVLGLDPVETTLQVCDTDENLYRFKDVFAEGYSLKLTALPNYVYGPDENGDTLVFCRVPVQETPYVYGDYGTISVRDVGYWQQDESYVTVGGYESALYIDGPNKNYAYICIQYYVSAGSLGFNYDEFYPNE